MSDKLNENKTHQQSNEEIINELTEGIESQCLRDDTPCSSEDHIPNDRTSNESETEETDIRDDNDYVDEEALKDFELESHEAKEKRLQESIELKNRGNELFKSAQYLESLKVYTEGLNTCPLLYAEQRSFLYSNRAACKTKLGRTESAIEDCTKALELNVNYMRALLRRAQLYEQTDKLDEALADYQRILELDSTVPEARRAAVQLPPRIAERNEKMKEEMMGKLKDLGNLFLKPFGLSTENFKLQQDPNTGGYSVNFQNK